MVNQMQDEFQAQEALTQQQIQAQQGMNAPAIVQQQQEIQAAIIEQTNPIHVLEEVEMKLKGFKQQLDGTFKKISEPLMNNKGVGRMISILGCVVNQNTILSHLEKDEIGRLIVRVSDDIIDDLVLNWKDYEIKDKILLDHIVNVILIPSFMALKRAWKQSEKNWLNRLVLETISTAPRISGAKKEGFFNKIKL